ncbi:MAG: hypothetical protein LR011_04515 [Verrucomicrobia bacterium]|nr:hypothetical protein [Verrucomicrobiota bacterium]
MKSVFTVFSLVVLLFLATAFSLHSQSGDDESKVFAPVTNTLTDANLNLIQFPGNETPSNKLAALPQNSLPPDPVPASRPSMSYLDFLMWMSGLVLLGVIIVSVLSSISMRRSNRSASAALRRVQSDSQSRAPHHQSPPPAAGNPPFLQTRFQSAAESALNPQPHSGNAPDFHNDATIPPSIFHSPDLPEAFPDMTIHRRTPYHERTIHSGQADLGDSHASPTGLSSDDRDQLNRAIRLSRQDRGEDALSIVHDVADRCPDHAEVFLAKGVVLQNLLQWDQAIQAFDLCIQHNPSMPNAYLRKARLLERMQHVEESRACYLKALKLAV